MWPSSSEASYGELARLTVGMRVVEFESPVVPDILRFMRLPDKPKAGKGGKSGKGGKGSKGGGKGTGTSSGEQGNDESMHRAR